MGYNYKFGEKIKVKVKENSKWYFRVFIAYDEQYHRVLTVDPCNIEQFKDGLGFKTEPWLHHEPISEDDFEISLKIKPISTIDSSEHDENIQKNIKRDMFDKIVALIRNK